MNDGGTEMRGSGRQVGFTLIELVLVITIVAILAAVAMPRMVAMQKEARIARLQAVHGASRSASSIIHSLVLTKQGAADPAACPGTPTAADNAPIGAGTVCSESGLIAILHGYPSAVETAALGTANPGIVGAAGLTGVHNPSAALLAASGYEVIGTASVQTIRISGAASADGCSFTYSVPAAAGAAPIFSDPETSGC